MLQYDLLLLYEPDEQRVRKFPLTSFSRSVDTIYDWKPIEAIWRGGRPPGGDPCIRRPG